MLKYGPLDLENYNCGVIYSALIRAQHFLKGQFLLWYDGLGFGTPFPISPLIDLHPIFALSSFLSMRIVRLLFWIIHLSLGSFFFMKLCRLLSISRILSLISGFLYVFSLPTINYTITDDWVSLFVGWTMSPIIVFFLFRLLLQNKRRFNYLIFLLPIILAFTIYNAPSYLIPFVILFFCIILIFLYHPKYYKFKQLLTIFVITCMLVAPRYYYLLNETHFFPAGLASRVHKPIALNALLSNEFVPFNIDLFRSVANNNFSTWWSNAINRLKYHDATRTSFIGFVYFILAFTGIAILWRHLRGKSKQILDVLKASAVLGFFLALIFVQLPGSYFFNTIQTWQFRDQIVFFAIIVAAIQLQRLKEGIFKNYKIIIPLLILIQINHVLAYTRYLVFIWPFEMPTRNYFKSPDKNGSFLNWLKYYSNTSNNRILLSPQIEYEFENPPKYGLISEGFYAISDLNLHAGLNPVNGIFKGISMDRIYPSPQVSSGLIKSSYDLLKNSALLDIAGINFILMHESELENSYSLPLLWINKIIKAKVDTSQSRFGGTSVSFEGSGGPIQLFEKKGLAFGSTDFTVDFWVRFANIYGNQVLVGYPYYSPDKAWQIAWEEEFNSLKFSYSTDGSDNTDVRFPWSPSTDTWYHIAIIRKGSDLKAFVDGSLIGRKHHMGDASIHDSKDALLIGSRGTEEHFNGWLDEIRISKGIARWTSNFAPPSSEYKADSYTKLLLHCDGTEESYFRFKNTEVWVLLHNEDAWPRAFFISEKALRFKIDYRPECDHNRFLCTDLDECLSYKEEGKVGIKGDNGSYELTFSPKKEPSVIGLSTLYRPEWKAFVNNGEKSEIKPLFNAFIAIKVPPGVSQISLEFKQPLRILLLYLSLITFVICLLLTFIFLFKQNQCPRDYS